MLFYHMSAVAYAEHNCLRNDINKPALLGVIKVVAAGRRGRSREGGRPGGIRGAKIWNVGVCIVSVRYIFIIFFFKIHSLH